MRKVGIAGLRQQQRLKERYTEVGAQLSQETKTSMQDQLRSFKENLEQFLESHKKQINRDPHLRQEFFAMCVQLGIDPLSCKD
jgi:ESCRT-II complex subunit VPS22